MMAFEPTDNKLTISFDTVEQARVFKKWLCNSGEQHFWDYADVYLDEPEEIPRQTDYWSDPNMVRFSAQKIEERA